jgi:hypothetical protein
MKIGRVFVAAALAFIAFGANAQTVQQQVSAEKGKGIQAAQLAELEATIQAINLETREVVLRTADGKEATVVAGPEVKRLADLKVGDKVSIQYYESLTLKLDKVTGASPSSATASTEQRAEPTELPGGIKTTTTLITAKITAVDTAASTVTLIGPKGRSLTLDVDPEILTRVKVGDLVSAEYTEALAVSVARIEKK